MTEMSSVPWLTIMGLIPLVGSLVVAFAPGSALMAKRLALGFSLATLVVGIVAALQFQINSPKQFQLGEQASWIPQFGVSYSLGVDGIALVLILMSLVLTPICLIAAWNDVEEEMAEAGGARNVKTYFALLLVLETFMVGVFAATDVFLFYAFFEAMLIPIYFLIGRFGGARRQYAAMKFLLFSLAGGLVMLVAVIALYLQGPGGSDGFLIERLTGLSMDPTTERLLFVGFFVAFAIKAPMVPFHTWLPDAATESTPATATLLVGVLDKVGTFGMIRFCLQLFPEASHWATPVVVVLAVISVIYGALLAIGQTDMMRLISYTSVSHFGFIVLGIFAFTNVGSAGSTLYMVNHGFSTAALFLFAAMLVHRRGSKRIPDYGGWQSVTPALGGIFLIAAMSALALPGLSTFVSEFLVLVGTFPTRPAAAVIATSGIILAALYMLLMYKKIMTGPPPGDLIGERALARLTAEEQAQPEHARRSLVRDLSTREKLLATPLIAVILVLGFYPNLALNPINPAVDKSLSHVLTPATGNAAAEGSSK